MKRLVGSALVVFVSFLAATCHADESQPLTVSGKVLRIGKASKIVDEVIGTRTQEENSRDRSQAPSVVITQTEIDDEGIPVTIEVASASFRNGAVQLTGMIDEQTSVLISVDGVGEETLSLNAVVAPGEHLSFAILDYVPPRRKDRILRIGKSRINQQSDAKFSIQGDLSSINDKDLSVATAEIRFMSGILPNGSIAPTSTSVLLDDGKFQFEGIVSEPLVLQVHVKALRLREYWGIAHIVVEPDARIKISPSKTSSSLTRNKASELKATSEMVGSIHSELVESWQNSTAYLAKMDNLPRRSTNRNRKHTPKWKFRTRKNIRRWTVMKSSENWRTLSTQYFRQSHRIWKILWLLCSLWNLVRPRVRNMSSGTGLLKYLTQTWSNDE